MNAWPFKHGFIFPRNCLLCNCNGEPPPSSCYKRDPGWNRDYLFTHPKNSSGTAPSLANSSQHCWVHPFYQGWVGYLCVLGHRCHQAACLGVNPEVPAGPSLRWSLAVFPHTTREPDAIVSLGVQKTQIWECCNAIPPERESTGSEEASHACLWEGAKETESHTALIWTWDKPWDLSMPMKSS